MVAVSPARRTSATGSEQRSTMKVLFVIIGVVVIFGLLISSGGVAGALCVEGVGCVRSSGGGLTVDDQESVTVQTGRP